jgi:hypothetical protein
MIGEFSFVKYWKISDFRFMYRYLTELDLLLNSCLNSTNKTRMTLIKRIITDSICANLSNLCYTFSCISFSDGF